MHMVALGTACHVLSAKGVEHYAEEMRTTRDELHRLLSEAFPDLELNGCVSMY